MTDNGRVKAGDYWREDSGSINFLEARALLCALDAFKSRKPVGGRPFLSLAVYNCLRVCLSEAKLYNGETLHSFRVGLSNTLSVLGCSPEGIAQYLGWKSNDMARHYARVSQTASTLTLLESVMPQASTVTARVSHPANIQPIAWSLRCSFSCKVCMGVWGSAFWKGGL